MWNQPTIKQNRSLFHWTIEKFADTLEITRNRKLKRNQHNVQKKENKKTINDRILFTLFVFAYVCPTHIVFVLFCSYGEDPGSSVS
jgi:hypothetical protein